MFYNASKGGTDVFDRLCADTSCSRKTRRWPLCMFYTLINIIMNNSYIIYKKRPNREYREKCDFLESMAFNLCKPWALHRFHVMLVRHPYLKSLIANTFNLSQQERLQVPPAAVLPVPL